MKSKRFLATCDRNIPDQTIQWSDLHPKEDWFDLNLFSVLRWNIWSKLKFKLISIQRDSSRNWLFVPLICLTIVNGFFLLQVIRWYLVRTRDRDIIIKSFFQRRYHQKMISSKEFLMKSMRETLKSNTLRYFETVCERRRH